MEILLRFGFDVKGKDPRGRTPLHFSVREGDLELVRELMSSGVEVNERDREGLSALHYAVKFKSKYKEDLRVFVGSINERIKVNTDGDKLETLHISSEGDTDRDRSLNLIRVLLEGGADVKAVDYEGISPLHYTLKTGRGVNVVRLLLKNGASVHAKDNFESSPLHYIMKYYCDIDVLRELLKYGADVAAVDYEGMTPLHYALKNGRNVDIVRELLKYGASVNVRDKFDSSSLHYVMEYNCNIEVLRELLKNGADVAIVDCDEMTPLHYALMKKRNVDVVRELLVNGASVNAKDNLGSSPLHYSIDCNCDMAVLKELLKHGADVEASDPGGNPPLHVALLYSGRYFKKNRIIDVIKALLDFGANIKSEGKNGTLFELALEMSSSWASKLVELSIFPYFITGKIEELIQYISSLKVHLLSNHMNRCVEELEKIKHYKICGDFSLSRFIMKEGRAVKPIYSPENLDLSLEITLKFPIYKDDLLLIINPCLWRGTLLKCFKDIQLCTRLGPSSCNVLNDDCMFLISEYLSNEELYNFVSAFKSVDD